MSHMDKKARKKAQLKKNRFNQEIFHMLRLRRDEEGRVTELAEVAQPTRQEKAEDEKVWSEKVASVRNRLTDKKRDSKERWNRFAGTSGGGGRGL